MERRLWDASVSGVICYIVTPAPLLPTISQLTGPIMSECQKSECHQLYYYTMHDTKQTVISFRSGRYFIFEQTHHFAHVLVRARKRTVLKQKKLIFKKLPAHPLHACRNQLSGRGKVVI